MLRVVKPKNSKSNGSASLGFEAKVWIIADSATSISAHPEFGFLPNSNDNFAWVRRFISC
jgi:hypothetical protein